MDRILKEHRKSILTAVAFVLLAVLMWLRQSADSHTENLTREKPGGSVRQEQIICQTGDGVTQELELEIHPQEYSEQETEEYVRQAVSLWEQEYLGENDSEKAIYEALKLPDTMMDGMVTVSYESSEYDIYMRMEAFHWNRFRMKGFWWNCRRHLPARSIYRQKSALCR